MPDPAALWRPASEEDLLRAARDRQLDESTTGIEFKERLGDGREGNRKFTQEMASLAVNGGTIIVGVVDRDNRQSIEPVDAVAPQPLHGLVERIESLARNSADPPIAVDCTTIEAPAKPDHGYVIVDVPQSMDAPHFVGGRPYGRNGTQKAVLNSAEVAVLIERRRLRAHRADDELEAARRHRPYSDSGTEQNGSRNGFMYLVAVPLAAGEDQGYESFSDEADTSWVHHLVKQSDFAASYTLNSLFDSPHVSRSVDGLLLSSDPLRDGQPMDGRSWEGVDLLELTYDGTVRFFSGGASRWRTVVNSAPDRHYLMLRPILASLRRTLNAVGLYGTRMNYLGSWTIALQIDGVDGAAVEVDDIGISQVRYTATSYRRRWSTTTRQLATVPGAVTHTAADRLLRALRLEEHPDYSPYMADDE